MLVLAVAIGALALALFAQLTGWAALARAYPHGSGPHGPIRPTRGVVVGPSGWNAPPLRAGLDDTGIFLSPLPPFRLFFRPLLVPWGAVTGFERREYMFFEVFRLRCGEKTVIGFLPSAVTSAIERRLRERLATNGFQEPKTAS
jgi:hypothetical protein